MVIEDVFYYENDCMKVEESKWLVSVCNQKLVLCYVRMLVLIMTSFLLLKNQMIVMVTKYELGTKPICRK